MTGCRPARFCERNKENQLEFLFLFISLAFFACFDENRMLEKGKNSDKILIIVFSLSHESTRRKSVQTEAIRLSENQFIISDHSVEFDLIDNEIHEKQSTTRFSIIHRNTGNSSRRMTKKTKGFLGKQSKRTLHFHFRLNKKAFRQDSVQPKIHDSMQIYSLHSSLDMQRE